MQKVMQITSNIFIYKLALLRRRSGLTCDGEVASLSPECRGVPEQDTSYTLTVPDQLKGQEQLGCRRCGCVVDSTVSV